MSKRKGKSQAEPTRAAPDHAGPTAIYDLAVRSNDLANQACFLWDSEAPGARRRAELLKDEVEFLKQKLFNEPPQTLAGVAIQALLAFDALGEERVEEEEPSPVCAMLLQQIRFFIDGGLIDLGDPSIIEIAQLALTDWDDLFPELAVQPAKPEAA